MRNNHAPGCTKPILTVRIRSAQKATRQEWLSLGRNRTLMRRCFFDAPELSEARTARPSHEQNRPARDCPDVPNSPPVAGPYRRLPSTGSTAAPCRVLAGLVSTDHSRSSGRHAEFVRLEGVAASAELVVTRCTYRLCPVWSDVNVVCSIAEKYIDQSAASRGGDGCWRGAEFICALPRAFRTNGSSGHRPLFCHEPCSS